MEEISITQKDLFLAPFPFSDLTLEKVRPVIVLSNDKYNENSTDVIVCAVTSKAVKLYGVDISTNDLKTGKLFKKSHVKYDAIFRINKNLLVKNIGSLNSSSFNKIKKKIFALF